MVKLWLKDVRLYFDLRSEYFWRGVLAVKVLSFFWFNFTCTHKQGVMGMTRSDHVFVGIVAKWTKNGIQFLIKKYSKRNVFINKSNM